MNPPFLLRELGLMLRFAPALVGHRVVLDRREDLLFGPIAGHDPFARSDPDAAQIWSFFVRTPDDENVAAEDIELGPMLSALVRCVFAGIEDLPTETVVARSAPLTADLLATRGGCPFAALADAAAVAGIAARRLAAGSFGTLLVSGSCVDWRTHEPDPALSSVFSSHTLKTSAIRLDPDLPEARAFARVAANLALTVFDEIEIIVAAAAAPPSGHDQVAIDRALLDSLDG